MNTGLYTITSPSGKFYLGSTQHSFQRRWNSHRSLLRKGTHHSHRLQSAWNKYGQDKLVFAVYLRCEKHECIALEQIAIDTMRPAYNVATDVVAPGLGLTGSKNHNFGKKMPVESCEQISASLKIIWQPRK